MFDPNFPPVDGCYPPRGFESPEFSMPDADPAELTITRPLLEEAAAAKAVMAGLSDGKKAEVLHTMADCLEAAAEEILAANAQDLEAAKDAIAPVMLDRLRLTPDRIRDMAKGVREVAALPDPVGRTLATHTLDNGLTVTRVSVPLGVIAIIFESRPNVTSDAASLTFRAGSVCVLRGGKESIRSNTAIVAALHRALEAHGLPKALVSLVADTSRASANELMAAVGYVDLLIPRGGAGLIRTVVEKAKVPVIQTGTGICHIYVDAAADLDMALTILNNAKTSRPSVCNAAEVCLIHRAVADRFLPMVREKLGKDRFEAGLQPVELRLDQRALAILPGIPAGFPGRGHRPHRRPLHRPQRGHHHVRPRRRRPVHPLGGQRGGVRQRLHPVYRRGPVRPGVRDGHLHPEAPRPGPHGPGGADQLQVRGPGEWADPVRISRIPQRIYGPALARRAVFWYHKCHERIQKGPTQDRRRKTQ